MTHTNDWFELARVALPFFGNDLERVLWSVDVRQLVAVMNGTLGDPGDGLHKRLMKRREQELTIKLMKDIGREDAST